MKVLYFAWLAERLGKTEEHIRIPPTSMDRPHSFDGHGLLNLLATRYPEQSELLHNKHSLRLAVNHDLVDWSTPLQETDEIAIFPPMTGG